MYAPFEKMIGAVVDDTDFELMFLFIDMILCPFVGLRAQLLKGIEFDVWFL